MVPLLWTKEAKLNGLRLPGAALQTLGRHN